MADTLYSPAVAIDLMRNARETVRKDDATRGEERVRAAQSGGAPAGTSAQQITEAMRPKRLISSISGAMETFGGALDTLSKSMDEARITAEKRKKREEKLSAQIHENLKMIHARHEFSWLVRWEEIQRWYSERHKEDVDIIFLIDMIDGEEKSEKQEIAALKSRLPGYEKPMTSEPPKQLFFSQRKQPQYDQDALPTDRPGGVRWLERKHSFYTIYQEVKQQFSNGNRKEQTFFPPPLVGDIFVWRAKVVQMKTEYFPYPLSLEEIEDQD